MGCFFEVFFTYFFQHKTNVETFLMFFRPERSEDKKFVEYVETFVQFQKIRRKTRKGVPTLEGSQYYRICREDRNTKNLMSSKSLIIVEDIVYLN